MVLNLCQTPTGRVNDGISAIVMSLVEGSPKARPTSIGVQFKWLHKISVCKNGCCGAQVLQVIKQLLAPVVPGNGCPLLTCIFAGHQFMQGLGYLHELGDELAIVSHESKKTLDLSDSGGGRLFTNSIYFAIISNYSLGRDNVSQICNLPVE